MAKLSARSSPPASPAGAALPARGAAGACTPRFMSGGAAWTATVHPAADKASANANRREGTAAGSSGEPERRDTVRPAGGAQGRGPGRGDRSALPSEVVGRAAGLSRAPAEATRAAKSGCVWGRTARNGGTYRISSARSSWCTREPRRTTSRKLEERAESFPWGGGSPRPPCRPLHSSRGWRRSVPGAGQLRLG